MEFDIGDTVTNVANFYDGKSIFITGGTGFIGKALVEKLLRSLPGIKEIFLLMRPKKGSGVDARLRKILSSELYDKLRETNPSAFEKIIPVLGDMHEEGLGLGPVERQVLIDRVSIIFHVAASVRFDDSLRDAVFVNLRSTRDICILAGSMKKLAALVHISSTYAHSDRPVVEEILYPPKADWRKTIKIAESIDNDFLKAFTSKYMGEMANTYVFTKNLAESVIADYSDRLPCVIARPSIVVACLKDPLPGWLDNLNGPVGLMIGGGKGLLRTIYANPDVISDYIPVDTCVKTFIVAACIRGRITVTKDPRTHVYNCSSSQLQSFTMSRIITTALEVNKDIPLDYCIWSPATTITTCPVNFYINVLLFHLIPALIIDQILRIMGHKPILVKLQRKIYIANVSIAFFMFNQWTFPNNKTLEIAQKLAGEDKKKFFVDYHAVDRLEFLKNGMIGAKKYLLHEDMNQLDKVKRHQNRMWWIDRICKVLWLVFFVWLVNRMGLLSYAWNTIYDEFDVTSEDWKKWTK